ncbi:hypothetical protein SLS53_002768 [Cytospora paraplurivora]|uniref:Uncharacterized protein n=1 Tax=Cytospora paraplurivora TaxID=2898453 RepID=A0AAN9UCQ9_9PEZI
MHLTPPPTSSPGPDSQIDPRRRRRERPEPEPEPDSEEDAISTEEEFSNPQGTEYDSEDDTRQPTTTSRKPQLKQPPPRFSEGSRKEKSKTKIRRPLPIVKATGTSTPVYRTNASEGESDSSLPPRPTQRGTPPRIQRNPAPPAGSTRPRRPRNDTPRSALDSDSSDSSSGPWQPLSAAAAPPSRPTTSSSPSSTRRKRPAVSSRQKTDWDSSDEHAQSLISRARRKIAVRRVDQEGNDFDDLDDVNDAGDDDDDDDDDDDGDDGGEVGEEAVMPVVVPPRPAPKSQVAGGKKAKLAVELKLNLEIEIQLKVHIQGDLTLELF